MLIFALVMSLKKSKFDFIHKNVVFIDKNKAKVNHGFRSLSTNQSLSMRLHDTKKEKKNKNEEDQGSIGSKKYGEKQNEIILEKRCERK
jgi:hypothetical protein